MVNWMQSLDKTHKRGTCPISLLKHLPLPPLVFLKINIYFFFKKKLSLKRTKKKEVNKYKNNGNLSSFDISTFVFLPSIQQVN